MFRNKIYSDKLDLNIFKEIKLVGNSFLVKNDQSVFYPSSCYPGYLKETTNRKKLFLDQNKQQKKTIFIDKLFVITHLHTHMYGNFLFECLPAIFAVKKLYENGINLPIYIQKTNLLLLKNIQI